MSAFERQEGGEHYKKMGDAQPWKVLAKWMTPEELRGFAKGTAIVYLAREGDKGGTEDIRKAIHTLELYLELSAPPAPRSGTAAKPGFCKCGKETTLLRGEEYLCKSCQDNVDVVQYVPSNVRDHLGWYFGKYYCRCGFVLAPSVTAGPSSCPVCGSSIPKP